MAHDHSVVVTVLKNMTSAPLVCSFLPPHGHTLAAGAEIEIPGDIIGAIRHMRRTGSKRLVAAFLTALDQGLLKIVATPAPVLEDVSTRTSKVLILNNNNLATDWPHWDLSLSAA